jgi:hypothetical protein
LAGVEANVLLTIEFDVEGIVSRVYPANGGVADEWGFTQSAVEAASKMRSSRPFAEPLQICWVVGFRLS